MLNFDADIKKKKKKKKRKKRSRVTNVKTASSTSAAHLNFHKDAPRDASRLNEPQAARSTAVERRIQPQNPHCDRHREHA